MLEEFSLDGIETALCVVAHPDDVEYGTSAAMAAWIAVPLDLTSPEGITALAATITLTPGTVTADVSQNGNALLVHCLHAPDPDAVAADIKSRYESRLLRIFS